MKTRVMASALVLATLALAGCSKTENTNVSINESATSENASMDLDCNVTSNSSNAGDTMHGDETHPATTT